MHIDVTKTSEKSVYVLSLSNKGSTQVRKGYVRLHRAESIEGNRIERSDDGKKTAETGQIVGNCVSERSANRFNSEIAPFIRHKKTDWRCRKKLTLNQNRTESERLQYFLSV